MRISTILALVLLALPLLSCVIDDEEDERLLCPVGFVPQDGGCVPAGNGCDCPPVLEPVCGEDMQTYFNECYAACLEVRVSYPGTCDPRFGCDECDDIYDPVCGSDHRTYPTDCDAVCAGVREYSPGECEMDDDCHCGMMYSPVCGTDGRNWPNRCMAECHGVEVVSEGECEGGCICPENYDPVCGVDGQTYSNRCFAACAGVEIIRDGECEGGCDCPDIYQPVCGANGQTYENACRAECERVEVARPGACEDDGECWGIACFAYQPVCGTDGQTYPCGGAIADCLGVEIAHEGECQTNDECWSQACLVPEPVCGVDGQTYPCGGLIAECLGVEIAHRGECGEPCGCPEILEPVCAGDGRVYPNICEAECRKQTVEFQCELRDPATAMPVCGQIGAFNQTFPTTCHLECARAELVHEGACTGEDCPPEIECIWEGEGVCASDGQTYYCGSPNLECMGLEVLYPGPCQPEECGCTKEYRPVCSDGQTYGNECLARCMGVERFVAGECAGPGIACAMAECEAYDPVCAEDGITYPCGGQLPRCEGKQLVMNGPCPPKPDCYCTMHYDPVCGWDGETYSNLCRAECESVPVKSGGECP